jgi:hypothetical protein
MKLIDQYEKEGNVIEVDSLLTTNHAIIDIKQIFILGNTVYVSFDMEHERILTKKASSTINSCKCDSCQ